MELKSDPDYPRRAVTDLTFRFVGGGGWVIRLVSGRDQFTINEDSVHLVLHKENGDVEEEQFIERRNLLYWLIKDDMETMYPPGESPAEKEALRQEMARAEREEQRSVQLQNRRLDKFYQQR